MKHYLNFTHYEARTTEAIFNRLFPEDAYSASATDIGVMAYLDNALSGAYADKLASYRLGLRALDRCAYAAYQQGFATCTNVQQDTLLGQLERGELADFDTPKQEMFFKLLIAHMQEGLFSDPAYGGNKEMQGWKFLKHPGVWLEHSAAEQQSAEPADKQGRYQSLQDLGYSVHGNHTPPTDIPFYNPQQGGATPNPEADVIIIGFGGMGTMIAPTLCKAGLNVVALEAGPWRQRSDFIPDELGAAYYGRGNMGPKFNQELPRWRTTPHTPTQEATFSLGRMMNGVAGSIVHTGAWWRRFHPHHFHMASYVDGRWGQSALPDNATLADWPVSYEELEPYFTQLEYAIGVAGNADENPFVPRSKPLPMPPLRSTRFLDAFKKVAEAKNLHPHMVPVGHNSIPYDGRPANAYHPWHSGFGSIAGDMWDPTHTLVPEALATGNLDLRTHCRVLRILTDEQGRASGVEYIDANGELRVQKARTVIMSSYTFENVRLLFLSGDAKHPDGLGNTHGQLGKHFMTKMFAHVGAMFDGENWNRHTGSSSQGVVFDDFLSTEFDSAVHGFIGGATIGAEMQFLPLDISRESRPQHVPTWGQTYKDHLRHWQNFGIIRIQPDTLSYHDNYIDLDPLYKDKSGWGLPVVRLTYEMQVNEHRLAEYMETWAETALKEMGATQTWRGSRFTGVCSSHDLGGTRMGHDPVHSVVSRDLEVHDTPGLYVFSGSSFPSCPGINPTLTMWAVCLRAADALVAKLKGAP